MSVLAPKQIHTNPLYGCYCVYPFVWKHNEVYYAIGTGALEASDQTVGKIFPILQSQWTEGIPTHEQVVHFAAMEVLRRAKARLLVGGGFAFADLQPFALSLRL